MYPFQIKPIIFQKMFVSTWVITKYSVSWKKNEKHFIGNHKYYKIKLRLGYMKCACELRFTFISYTDESKPPNHWLGSRCGHLSSYLFNNNVVSFGICDLCVPVCQHCTECARLQLNFTTSILTCNPSCLSDFTL